MKTQLKSSEKFVAARRNYELAEKQYFNIGKLLELAIELKLESQINYLEDCLEDAEMEMHFAEEQLDIESIEFFGDR